MNKLGAIITLSLAVATGAAGQMVEPSLAQKNDILRHIIRARAYIDNPKYSDSRDLEIALEVKMKLRYPTGSKEFIDSRHKVPTEEDLKKISGGWFRRDERGDYANAVALVQNAQAAARWEYQTAVNMTMAAYNIPDPSGQIYNGPPGNIGHFVVADPRIVDWTAEPEVEVGHDLGDFSGGSDGNFRLIVVPAAFFDSANIPPGASPDPDPGYLASVLYHESLHASEATDKINSLDLRNAPAAEVRIRLKQLLGENIFQIPSHQFLLDFEGLLEENDLTKTWDDAMQAHKDPYLQEDREQVFNTLAISAKRAREIIEQAHHDARELMSATDASDPASLEQLREQAQTSFIKSLDDDQLGKLVSAWKQSLQVDADYSVTKERLFLLHVLDGIERCGFTPQNGRDGAFHGAFSLDSHGWTLSYSVKGYTHMTEEQYRVGVTIAATCAAMASGHAIAPSCSDGIAIASDYADDPGFKAGIHFQSQSTELTPCIEEIRDGLRSPMSAQDYDDLARRAFKDYSRNVRTVDDQDRQYAESQQNSSNAGATSSNPSGVWRPHPIPINPGSPQPPTPGQCWFEDEKAVCD